MHKTFVLFVMVASFLLTSCFSGAQELQAQNEKLRAENAELNAELHQSEQVISDYKATLARYNTGGLEAQRVELDQRRVELERREKDLLLQEKEVAENLREVGQAEQVRQEYAAMKQARDEAENKIGRLWMYIYGVSVFTLLAIIGSGILIVRYWIRMKQHEQAVDMEKERREQVIKVMEKIPPTSITPDVVRSLMGLSPYDISKQLSAPGEK